MAQFLLKNNFFEFNNDVFRQISGTEISTKFALSYAYIFMDQIETEILRTQNHQPMVWFRYIDDMFLFGLMGKKNLNHSSYKFKSAGCEFKSTSYDLKSTS